MKRFAWGIFIVVISLANLLFDRSPEGFAAINILALIGGGALIYFGAQYLKRVKTVTAFALQMIRESGKIDAVELAQRVGVSEVDIRGDISESQRKGIIPFKVDIV